MQACIHFRVLSAAEKARLTARQLQAWELRASGLTAREAAAECGATLAAITNACCEVRKRLGIVAERGMRLRPRRPMLKGHHLSPEEFEAKCEEETARELAAWTDLPGMREQDFQRCTHCGLRGHLPEACDLPERRWALWTGRAYHGVENEEGLG